MQRGRQEVSTLPLPSERAFLPQDRATKLLACSQPTPGLSPGGQGTCW